MLYIVATPIGNLQDITLRALETLRTVDLIICEDSRVTGNLLHHFEIKKPMMALNDFNEDTLSYEIIGKLVNGETAALVSDNGTPLISDPGYRLVKLAKEKKIMVIPIPGPSAIIAALSTSGLPTDSFMFLGFVPKTSGKKKTLFVHLHHLFKDSITPTIGFYESPHRILETVRLIHEIYGDIEIVIARELTKIHEDIRAQTASDWLTEFETKTPKGEITVLLSSKPKR